MSKANKPKYVQCTKSASQLKRTLRALRRTIEDPSCDAILMRVAYSAEAALLWLTDNYDWETPDAGARWQANLLRKELKANEQSH